MPTRRLFFKNAALGLAATAVPSVLARAQEPARSTRPTKRLLNLGMAGYTFRYFDIDQSIAMMQRVGIDQTTLKDFHLPYDSTPGKIKETINKFKQAGINIYGLGVIYMRTQEEVDKMFAYAKTAGVDMI